MLRFGACMGGNYLDTRLAGSYNRRPLSLGGRAAYFTVFGIKRAGFPLWLSKGIYGDDDPADSYRPQ